MREFKRIPQCTMYLFQKKMLSEFTSEWEQISYEKNGLIQCISKEEERFSHVYLCLVLWNNFRGQLVLYEGVFNKTISSLDKLTEIKRVKR